MALMRLFPLLRSAAHQLSAFGFVRMDRRGTAAVAMLGVALLFAGSASAQQPAPAQQRKAAPQVPSVSAVSLKRGNSIARTQSGKSEGRDAITESTKSSTRSAAVKVTLRSFSKPVEPYEVQCFFVAKDADRKRSVFDTKKVLSAEIVDEIDFFSSEMDGGKEVKTTTTRRTPVYPGSTTGPYRQGENGRPMNNYTAGGGSKLEGWIVRVISAGKVVRVESSLTELKRYAEVESAALDALAAAAATGAQ